MLELKDICFGVPEGSKEILKNINLTLEAGKLTVITGPNGGGKSTLAKIIMGIEKPTNGQILFEGQDITDMSITDRAKLGIAFAFQQPVRFKGVRVKDLITLAAGKNVGTDLACQYLSEVGLCALDYIDREVDASLSGGELKRIEIATVIARDAKLAVFDEPEAGIDLWSFQNLISLFERFHRKKENSVLVISHQERILSIADDIVVRSEGQVRQHDLREKVLPGLLGSPDNAENCRFL